MTLVYPIALEATGDVDPLTDLSEGIRPEFLHGAALAAKAFHKCWGPPPAAVAAPVAATASVRLGWRGLCALIDFHCD